MESTDGKLNESWVQFKIETRFDEKWAIEHEAYMTYL